MEKTDTRLFQFLTALTIKALDKNHIVSTALETTQKKKTEIRVRLLGGRCDQQFVMRCQEHNRSLKGNSSALASLRWLLCDE